MEVEAFQTLEDRDNADYIEENGPFKCRKANAWLGEGYYFWDSNINWAHEWGDQYYTNGYIICSAGILVDENCLDLVGNISHMMMFKEIIDKFIETGYLNPKKVYIAQIIELMKKRNMFEYKSIRSNDDKKAISFKFTENRKETTTLLRRTQICLVDKTNLDLQSFKIIYPEHYTTEN